MNVNKLNSACDQTREDWFHNERKGKADGETKDFVQNWGNNYVFLPYFQYRRHLPLI